MLLILSYDFVNFFTFCQLTDLKILRDLQIATRLIPMSLIMITPSEHYSEIWICSP